MLRCSFSEAALAILPRLDQKLHLYCQKQGVTTVQRVIETERLLLVKPRLSDVPELFEFLGDPNAMSHTHSDNSLAECRRRIAVHEWKRRSDGFAPWVVRQKGRDKVIGWGGLYDDPFDPGWGIELAYYFHPTAWGKGFGTELSLMALKIADDELRVSQVSAFAHPENMASNRLLKCVGFEFLRYIEKMDRNLYSRNRPI